MENWKVLEFYGGIFQDWKVHKQGSWFWKVLQINFVKLRQKYEMYGRQ